jgi:hypothetical protein
MRKLQLLTAMAVGISATAIGAIQVEATTYNYFVDFSTKEVANFDDYTQSFSVDTYNLDAQITWNWSGSYKFDSCPSPFTLNVQYLVGYRLNNVAPTYFLPAIAIPDFTCTTTFTPYFASATNDLPDNVVELIMNDDANYIRFFVFLQFLNATSTPANGASGRTMSIAGYRNYFDITYDFNTTYLFNYFLSDQQFISKTPAASGSGWTLGTTQSVYLQYVYTTAGNDEYYINNSNVSTIGTTRKKYAIDYNLEYFRGESVGAGFTSDHVGTDTYLFTSGVNTDIVWQYNYSYLNTANAEQAIVDAPEFNFTYEDCGWDVFDIPCFINNGLAYITNDAPIISDAITLLNAGIAMAAQTFGIIGAFTTDNVFGYLILAGFGYIAVRWFLKND